ncbi:MAG: type II secretion system protein GspL, partial [Burkholderiales bacterium]
SLDPQDAGSSLPPLPAGITPQVSLGLRAWALAGEAEGAVNLCQFEFAPPLGGLLERLRSWRPALLLLGLALLLQLLALNAYWAKLAWQKHQINQSMQVLVRDTLPNALPDLAPALALKRALENQRAGQGGALPGDFSVLASRLTALLANEPGDTLQQLDYRDDSLYLRFKPGAAVKNAILHDEGHGVWRLSGGGR